MRVLVHVPARAGSKGVPGKNLRTVGGISLVGRAVRVGRQFLRERGLEGKVVVDTDGEAIAEEAKRWGAAVPSLRAPELACDTAATVDVVLAALDRLDAMGERFDVVVLLQPTSPLRVVDDLGACFDAHSSTGSALTVTEAEHPMERALVRSDSGVLTPVFSAEAAAAPRQSLASVWLPNGSVYVSTVAMLRDHRSFLVSGKTKGVAVPRERAVDIDVALDFVMAEALLAAHPVATMEIAGRRIGPGHPCFVIAEAGVNHNGDMKLAHRLVDAAADAGADAVKFQTFDPKKLVSDVAPMAEYQAHNTGKHESQAAMLERLVLPRAAHRELQEHAQQRGILFLSTPFDEGSGDFLEALGLPAFKVPSGEITNHPFLAHLAKKKRPMLVSTGMANMLEIAQALDVIAANGDPPVALFHCVTNYPATPSDTNLRAMDSMRSSFGRPTGMSDHSEGLMVMLASVARGAHLVEKHYTLDRAMAGPDHKASLEPAELSAMVRGVRDIEASLGDGVKIPRPAELPLIGIARKSLHAIRALSVGQPLTRDDVIALRPGSGLSPARLESLLGRPMAQAAASGELLTETHFAERRNP